MEGRKPERIRFLVLDVMHVYLREQTIKNANFCISGGIFRRKKITVITKRPIIIITIKTAITLQSNTRNSVGLVRDT